MRRYLKHSCDRLCLFTVFRIEGGAVWSVRRVRSRWCGWFLGLRAELHCNHNYQEEGGKRSLGWCESEESSRKVRPNSPTDLRILSHFTSSTSDRRSYKVTRDLFSNAYNEERMGRSYWLTDQLVLDAPRSQCRLSCLHPSLHFSDCRHPFGSCAIHR